MTIQCEQSVDRPPSFSHVVNTNLISTSDYIESVIFPLDSEAMIDHSILLDVDAAGPLIAFLPLVGPDVRLAPPVRSRSSGCEVGGPVKAAEQAQRVDGSGEALAAVVQSDAVLGENLSGVLKLADS